jgi:glyoxylase-like metal-dependent hydrolase (beta-lactamase superfamily II)
MSTPPEMLPRLHVLERGWLSSNNIVFDDDDGISVVDTGYVTHAEQTVQLIDRLRRGRPLTRIINTHLHSDHVGGNARLAAAAHRWSGASANIIIAPGQAAAVAAWDEDALGYAATGQQCERFAHHDVLRIGATLTLGGAPWEVLAAPGHDPHMVMLFEPHARVLISADALWENGFGAIFGEIEGEPAFAAQRAVLDEIARRAPRVVIPGHGAPFTGVAAALERAYGRLSSLAADPRRNANHIAKVLIKFWLLQVRATTYAELLAHFAGTRYMRLIHARYFSQQPLEALLDRILMELALMGAITRAGERVANRD